MESKSDIEEKFEKLIENFSAEEADLIRKSYVIATEALANKTRGNGAPFIEHPLNVAKIICDEMGLGCDAIIALFLHEASRKNEALFALLQREWPEAIMTIVEGLNHISEITPRETRLQAENYRKLIVSYSKDPRVTLIKIADRVEITRHLNLFPKSKIIEKLTETQMLYIPLAHQLGLYNIKSELENLYFQYSDPENYRAITNKLIATAPERSELISNFVKPLEEKLKVAGIKYTLKVRTKTAWSIWQKMQRQGVEFEGVYDVFAIRFILDVPLQEEKDYCWRVYSLVTQEYKPDVSRLRDWITTPKPNGYESLHTTVENREGARVEVQIRTRRMDEIAESGHASHWSYKGIKSVRGLDEWLDEVKKMLNTPGLVAQPFAGRELQEIFVFTPNGDLKQLPKGASVLDFAFAVHSKLGMNCTGGKINGKMASIRDELHTGDTVEIMSGKNQKPSRDWLNFVVSPKAKSKIRSKIKEEEEREILKPTEKERNREKGQTASKVTPDPENLIKEHRNTGKDYLVISDKIDNIGYKMAKCCNPLFGDDVFGFVTSTGYISIHRMSCPNAARLLTNYPYRIQKVKWRQLSSGTQFQTGLKIVGNGEVSIANSIVECIASQGASIRAFRISQREKSKTEFIAEVEISVGNNAHLDKVISALKKLREVSTVLRRSGERQIG